MSNVMTLEEQVKIVVEALKEKKAVDVKTYDVRGISGLCDAFVVRPAQPRRTSRRSSPARSGRCARRASSATA